MFSEQIATGLILFFILYGITAVVPFVAAAYLLLRRGNAFAPDVTPSLRLRRWAAAFFFVAFLGHVWWLLFYIYSLDLHSVAYVLVAVLDCVTLLTTIAGTLLAMLQDRKRPIWPAFAAMIPFIAFGVLQILYPDGPFMHIATIYILTFYVLFSVYMVFAVHQYGRWLNDNYADLENKKVWLSQVVSLACLLLFILYALVDADTILIYVLHIVELVLFALLLWRVETLPQLDSIPEVQENCPPAPETSQEYDTPASALPSVVASHIEQQLVEHCEDTQLYLEHDLTLQQLAQAVRTNRTYLSLYFSSHNTTYNAYINDLRINHFMKLYRKAITTQQSVTAQQLAIDSGYRSYSTFSLAFKQRMGQSVTSWMRETTE